jgi:hypothetical protein
MVLIIHLYREPVVDFLGRKAASIHGAASLEKMSELGNFL